jgi:lipopolysaccharide export system protein LptA
VGENDCEISGMIERRFRNWISSAGSGWPASVLLLALLLACLFQERANSQVQMGGLKLQELYPKRGPGDTNRLKYLITSIRAQVAGPSRYRAQGMRIENLSEDGTTNIVAKATECFLNNKDRTATSTNLLELEAGNGLKMEGYGFNCQLTNFTLYLSNRVRTWISRSLAEGNRGLIPSLGSAAAPAAALGTDTNLFMTVFSDNCYLSSSSNLIVYTGNIRVDSPQVFMSCAQLTIQRTTNGIVEYVLADKEVVILNKVDQSRASADRGYYSVKDGRETLDLSGHALWLEGQRSLRADAFSFDLKRDTLLAKTKVLLKLPRGMFSQAELFPAVGAAKTNRPPINYTNQFVEIHSEWMNVQLPGTNHVPRSITARTNVLMLSMADNMRATGEESVYNEANGVLRLNGKARWQADQRLITGDQLFFDRTNRVFRDAGHAYVRLPVSSFGSQPLPGAPSKTGASQFMEITSSAFEVEGDWLTFHEPVRGSLLEGDNPLGRLEAGFLALQFTNQIQKIVAKKKVFLEEFPVLKPDGRRVSKTFETENLDIDMATNGLVKQIVAHDRVHGTQHTWQTNKPPGIAILDAERMTADFFAHTNLLKDIVASSNVSIISGNRSAHGEMAIYTATNSTILLTGNPTADSPANPELHITDAAWIRWLRTPKTNLFTFSRLTAEGTTKTARTNQTGLPLLKAPEQPVVRQP